jgi:site-specific DNA-methyltransferase (adenine-specific)
MLRAQRHDWATPADLFDQLDREFGPFDLDPCGQREAHYSAYQIEHRGGLCYDGSTKALDGLALPWRGRVFMNPPHAETARWIEKAVSEVECGNAELVVALLPSRTDTRIWQKYILKEASFDRIAAPETLELVRFLPGRLKFGGAKGPAPFPSAIVVWRDTRLVPPAPAEGQERLGL